ncbi:acyltransferase family protein [Isoptericola haloaureus]|uniref:Acyltransferase family protein n=1 Tax=Isoptericola haloaureus TaxID=1542902 RepID=A0ABU7Z5K1_9MICO
MKYSARQGRVTASHHISELHGLRGLALVLVVVFHLFGNGRVSGGVDVFLLVSGFLLTRSLVRRADGPGISLAAHYARTAWRLVPPAALVLAVTALLTVALLPVSRWVEVGRETVASALYVENWALIAYQLEYGAAGPTASPLQHFWSLSVQGQFFALWPVVVVVLAWLARRAGRTVTTVVLPVLAVATAASFAYAVHLTATAQPIAYFSSLTRFWELGLGALLALVLPLLRLPDGLRATAAWLGVGLVVSTGFLLDGARLFPGPWTLWPVVGGLLVLVGAGTASTWGPRRALEARPLRFAADISYPLYLWHWPLLVFYLQVRGEERLTWSGATLVLAVSVVLAWVTRLVLNRPAVDLSARRSARPALLTAATLTVLVAVASGAGVATVQRHQDAELRLLAQSSPDHPGAAALAGTAGRGQGPTDAEFRPTTDVAAQDLPPSLADGDCIQQFGDGPGYDELLVCDSVTPPRPGRHVVIAGASHSYQWEPALQLLAEQHGWRLSVLGKSGCRLVVLDEDSDCARWAQEALQWIEDEQPDAVVVVGTFTPDEVGETEQVLDPQISAWQRLAAAEVPVVAIRDNPRFDGRVPDCVQDEGQLACTVARSEVLARRSPLETHADVPPNVHPVDLSGVVCTDDECPPVVGNVLVYRDDDHFTATYVRTLTPYLGEALRGAVPRLF